MEWLIIWGEHILFFQVFFSQTKSTIFLLTSAIGTCTMARKRCFMCWRIFFALGKTYKNTEPASWKWDFVIKSFWFQRSNYFKGAKIIYNFISNVCLIVFVHKLAIQSLEFNQTLCAHFTKSSHIFHNGCMALTLLWFPSVCETCVVILMAGKFKMMFFS